MQLGLEAGNMGQREAGLKEELVTCSCLLEGDLGRAFLQSPHFAHFSLDVVTVLCTIPDLGYVCCSVQTTRCPKRL